MQPSVKKRHHSDLSIIQTIVILPLAGRGLCECCMVLILACTPLSLLSFDHYLTFVLNNRNLTDNTNHYNALVASVHLVMNSGKIQITFLGTERCLSLIMNFIRSRPVASLHMYSSSQRDTCSLLMNRMGVQFLFPSIEVHMYMCNNNIFSFPCIHIPLYLPFFPFVYHNLYKNTVNNNINVIFIYM